jgi:hypothetical protein
MVIYLKKISKKIIYLVKIPKKNLNGKYICLKCPEGEGKKGSQSKPRRGRKKGSKGEGN